MIPFSIICTTCQTRLTVNSEEALGQILQCPKCNSMVAVPNSADSTTGPADAAEPPATSHQDPPTRPVSDSNSETVDHYDSSDISRLIDQPATSSSADHQAWEGQIPPESVTDKNDGAQPMLPTDDWSSPGSRQLRHRVLIGGLIAVCLLTVVAIFYVLSNKQENQPPIASPNPASHQSDQAPNVDPVQPSPEEKVDPVEEAKPVELPAAEDKKPEETTDPPKPTEPTETPKPTEPPGLTAEPVPSENEQAEAAELSQLLQEFSPLLSNTPFDQPTENQPGSTSSLPTTKLPKPPLRRVSMKSSLNFAIAEFTITEPISLHTFLTQVSTISGIPLEIDMAALASQNVTLDLPVTLATKQTTVRQLLQTILQPHGLGFIESDQSLTISYLSTEDERLQDVTYPVADLVSVDQQQATDLVNWIQSLITPGNWESADTGYQIKLQDNQLRIKHLPAAQFQVFRLLARLRMARKIDHPEPADERTAVVSLIPRVEQAEKLLNESISVNVTRSTPLLDIFTKIEQKLAVKFVLNGRTLRQSGWSARSDVTLVTDNETLLQSLGVLLTPMELTIRVIDANTLEITSLEDEVARREIEFYPVSHLLKKNRSPQQLIQLIQQKIGTSRFGDDQINQLILFDPTSKYLMIRESQSNHRKLSYLLSSG